MVRLGRRAADGPRDRRGRARTRLHYVGLDATAALAGLGIGGIAVALAAQKTLENVIGGLSIVIDQAVRVGDFIKLGDLQGTVDYIGLRSTRLRTPERTIVTVPNGQVATVNVETLSARDKFWFHHFVGLRYETTATQIRTVVDDIRTYLSAYPRIDAAEPIRARLCRFSPYSFDIEVFAYVRAANWDLFLEAQQELLLEIMDIVERSGCSDIAAAVADAAAYRRASRRGRAHATRRVAMSDRRTGSAIGSDGRALPDLHAAMSSPRTWRLIVAILVCELQFATAPAPAQDACGAAGPIPRRRSARTSW